jgi:hypothetical protein
MALTGQDLWPQATEGQIVRAILDEGIPPLEPLVRVAPEIAAFIARACHPDARARFQTAREMAETVEGFGRECGWVASHAEVAALLRALLGERLKLRRDALAQLSEGSRTSGAWSQDPAYRATTPERRRPANGAVSRSVSQEHGVLERRAAPPGGLRLRSWWRQLRRWKHGVALIFAGVALSVVAFVLLGPVEREAGEAPPPRVVADEGAIAPVAPAASANATGPPSPSGEVSAPGAGLESAVSSSVRRQRVGPAPAPPRTSAPDRSGSGPSEGQIRKKNPYRLRSP